MRLVRLSLSFAVAIVALSCSRGAPDLPGRPGSVPADDPLARELADGQMRVVTDSVTFLYNSGGVIMGRAGSGTLFAVNIATGSRVDFNYADQSLYINGLEIPVSGVSLARVDGDVRWYVISTASPAVGRVIFVTRY